MNARDAARRAVALRAERAAALAGRGTVRAGAAESAPFLVCACGSDRYGLPLAAVAQVLPARACTPVPGAAPALVGLIALSGRVVGVVDLARALGRPGAAPADGEPGHLVVMRGAPPLALAVDRVLGIARAAEAERSADGAETGALGNPAAPRYAPASDGSPDFVAIDLPRLLRRVNP
ncbi:chemotaxis protein CheW [Methylobacterium sp. NEAU 140]|uniref:chemotaxis protein CheW n=1 Tax=Methylobacterium sp. NEAU 140 TaxID=3064945 RepID=UPI002734F3EA|nr:chemotaxis protein CheW [Methylobacterium sp. NEAU 140]MDP4025057.1 chemotaxis protein CheW [Methylobacterium sp. NEAU 140]